MINTFLPLLGGVRAPSLLLSTVCTVSPLTPDNLFIKVCLIFRHGGCQGVLGKMKSDVSGFCLLIGKRSQVGRDAEDVQVQWEKLTGAADDDLGVDHTLTRP